MSTSRTGVSTARVRWHCSVPGRTVALTPCTGDARDRSSPWRPYFSLARAMSLTRVAQLSHSADIGRGALYHRIGSTEKLLFTRSAARISRTCCASVPSGCARISAPPRKLYELVREQMRQAADRRLELWVMLRDRIADCGPCRRDVQRLRDDVEQYGAMASRLAQGPANCLALTRCASKSLWGARLRSLAVSCCSPHRPGEWAIGLSGCC